MAGLTLSRTAQRAGQRLQETRQALIQAVVDAMYRDDPSLERYGPYGRECCVEDVGFALGNLVPAVTLERPDMFASYATWADDVLSSRGVPTAELRESLRRLGEAAAARLPPEEAGVVGRCVEAALEALDK